MEKTKNINEKVELAQSVCSSCGCEYGNPSSGTHTAVKKSCDICGEVHYCLPTRHYGYLYSYKKANGLELDKNWNNGKENPSA